MLRKKKLCVFSQFIEELHSQVSVVTLSSTRSHLFSTLRHRSRLPGQSDQPQFGGYSEIK